MVAEKEKYWLLENNVRTRKIEQFNFLIKDIFYCEES